MSGKVREFCYIKPVGTLVIVLVVVVSKLGMSCLLV